MDPGVLELKYKDMLKYAKDLGINFPKAPKQEQIIEQIQAHYEQNQEDNKKSKSSRRGRNTEQSVNYNETEEEPKKKQVKKSKKSKTETVVETEINEPQKVVEKKVVKKKKSKKIDQNEENLDNLKEDNIVETKPVKKKKSRKVEEVEEKTKENLENSEDNETKSTKKVKKVKANLKNNETEEMKRMRRSIAEKKDKKLGKDKKATSGTEDENKEQVVTKKLTRKTSKINLTDDKNKEVEEPQESQTKSKVKKTKKIKFSEDDAVEISGDASNKMKRRILKKKKKSSSPILKPITANRRQRSTDKKDEQAELDNDTHNSILAETNEIIEKEEINDDQFQLKLDDDSNEPVEKTEVILNTTQKRKSVAFIIDNNITNTTPVVTNQTRRSIISNNTTTPNTLRRSIAFTIDTNTPEPIITQATTPKSNRKSIAFTIDNTTQGKVASATFTTIPNTRRSIVINNNDQEPVNNNYNNEDASNLTNDDDTLNRTYEKPESEIKNPPIQITSPVVSCASFYKTNNNDQNISMDLNGEEEESNAPVVVAKPAPRARIVRPKQIETTVETMFKSKKFNQVDEYEVKKVVEVVRREAGPRIVKPTAPSPKVNDLPKKKPVLTSSKTDSSSMLKKPKAVKMPDFKAIHNKQFNKGEDISESQNRIKQRHNLIQTGKVPKTLTTKSTEEKPADNTQTYVSSAIGYASSMLKKLAPFGQKSNDTENTPKAVDNKVKTLTKDSLIPKKKFGQVENKAPRTPLGTRTINNLKTPTNKAYGTPTNKIPSVVERLYNPKTPQSNRKPKTFPSILDSATKKPTLSKPFHFQNQNLEAANINFGASCNFGISSGTTPLKDSAFNRRKSYNPRESIGRPLSYNPHIGKLKPLELKKSKENMNESVSVKTSSVIVATEKRKSIFGLQKNMEKDKLLVKRKVMRNNEMDKPRILQN